MYRSTILTLPLSFLVACTSPTPLPTSKTAYEQYSALGWHDKNTAGQFYGLGQADAWKKQYWVQRRMQENGQASEEPKLQHRYLNVPVEAHTNPDGTQIEASTHAVEIVQFVEAVKSHGRTLNIVK